MFGALLTTLLLAGLPQQAAAEEKGVLGAGLILGEPTGLSLKYYLNNDTAIDVALGGAFVGKGIQIHADYLWHPVLLEQKPSFVLPLYIGAGMRILDRNGGGGDEDHVRIGVRGVGGVLFEFTKIPIDVFVEVAGVVDYRTRGPAFGLDLNLGAGVRYYF